MCCIIVWFIYLAIKFLGENTYNGDQSDAHQSTFSSSKEVIIIVLVLFFNT